MKRERRSFDKEFKLMAIELCQSLFLESKKGKPSYYEVLMDLT